VCTLAIISVAFQFCHPCLSDGRQILRSLVVFLLDYVFYQLHSSWGESFGCVTLTRSLSPFTQLNSMLLASAALSMSSLSFVTLILLLAKLRTQSCHLCEYGQTTSCFETAECDIMFILSLTYIQISWLSVDYILQERRRAITMHVEFQQPCSVIGRYRVQHWAHKMGSISSSRQVIHDHDKEEVSTALLRRLVFNRYIQQQVPSWWGF
jgi:hypothetical protein